MFPLPLLFELLLLLGLPLQPQLVETVPYLHFAPVFWHLSVRRPSVAVFALGVLGGAGHHLRRKRTIRKLFLHLLLLLFANLVWFNCFSHSPPFLTSQEVEVVGRTTESSGFGESWWGWWGVLQDVYWFVTFATLHGTPFMFKEAASRIISLRF